MKLELIRDIYHEDYTAGRLIADGEIVCFTLECPWLNNEPSISCVPDGVYRLEPYKRPNGDHVWILLNKGCCTSADELHGDVLTRWGILIHSGTTVKDTQGCILPGIGRSTDYDKVWNSRKAMELLRQKFATEMATDGYIELTIRSPAAT